MTGSALRRKTLISVLGPPLLLSSQGVSSQCGSLGAWRWMVCRGENGSTQDKELGVLDLQVRRR